MQFVMPAGEAEPPGPTHLVLVPRPRYHVERYAVRLGGARVNVDRYQPTDPRPSEPPVVFLHGWGMSASGYRPGLAAIATAGVQVDAVALPGYEGSSPLPLRACGLSEHADHVAAVLDQADLTGPLHLAGHSFGGGIALQIAASRPDLVSRVTAVCPAGGAGGGCSPWPDLLRSLLVDGGSSGLTMFARSFAPAVRRNAMAVALTGLAARRADLVHDLQRAVAHRIDVHLILADQDRIVPPGPLAHGGSGARISVVPGRHNWPHVNPQAWADLTLAPVAFD